MKQIIKTLIYSTFLMVAFSSCRDEIILDLNTVGPIPVIEGNISNDSIPFKVRVTTTADYYSLEIPKVTDAQVVIKGSNGSIDTLYHDSAGYYETKYIRPCKVGVSYTLEVLYKGKIYTATETCRPQDPIDSVKMIYTPKRAFLPAAYYIWEWAQERPGIGDCYQWNIYRNDTLLNEDFYFLNDDQLVDGQYLSSDFFFPFQKGDSMVLEQLSISRGIYNYLNSVQNQTNRDGSPFSAPPSNLTGNISNGAMGYFSVKNIQRRSLRVK